MRYGWLKIPDVQDGDRTLEEQMAAVWPAVEEARGKTVLDLGCCEGLIALEFAKAGAKSVLGIEFVSDHLVVARELCAGYPMQFRQWNLCEAQPESPMPHDVVLALGIIHKLEYPERGLRFAARSAKDLLLLRCGLKMSDGIIKAKHFKANTANVRLVMGEEGFVLEKTLMGPFPHRESVEYWRRK